MYIDWSREGWRVYDFDELPAVLRKHDYLITETVVIPGPVKLILTRDSQGNISHGWMATIHVSEGEELTDENMALVTTYLENVKANEEKQRRARELAGRLDDKTPNRRR